MKHKHSPAPWRIEGPYLRSADGYNIAVLHVGPEARDQANRDLILSAPDLLAQRDELKEALRDLITHDLMCCETDGQEPGEMCRKAQAALAKCEAKGPQ